MKRWALLLALAWISACSAEPKPEPDEITDAAITTYNDASERLVREFLEAGQVVSRAEDGSARHFGDSLLWTGMAIGVLPCRLIRPLEDALIANIEANAGHVVRFQPLPDVYRGGREASLDGVLGLWWGVARLAKRCGIGPHWAHAFGLHLDAIERTREVYPGAAPVVPWFDVVLEHLAHSAGLRGSPSSADRLALGAQVAGWATAVRASKAAGYRIHLGWLALTAIEEAGGDVDSSRDLFCGATDGVGMVLIDHWCGRDGLPAFIASFEFNAWEYFLQRAPWESADGNGLKTPALDLLVALTAQYGDALK